MEKFVFCAVFIRKFGNKIQVCSSNPEISGNRPAGYIRSFLLNLDNKIYPQVPVNIRIDF